jgi:hypothetical protein
MSRTRFLVELIKPSHYDDDGYVIQWLRTFVPSNSLACLHALVKDVQERRALGDDVDIVLNTCDEIHAIVSTKKIIRRIRQDGGRGIVFLTGVQSNQFPRAADLAREFRAAGIDVVIGGFHVSGCLSICRKSARNPRCRRRVILSPASGTADGTVADGRLPRQ